MGVKGGDKVADIFAGSFTPAFSKAVGPTGKVYAVVPAELIMGEAANGQRSNT